MKGGMSKAQSIAGTDKAPFDFTGMFPTSAEHFYAAQKAWMEAAERANRDLVALFEAEAKLGSEFATKVREAKAVPDVVAAYQAWVAGRMELNSKEWQNAVEDGQKLVNACARMGGNGRSSRGF
jgi:hypothetical protein